MKCPRCGSDGPFRIEVKTFCLIYDDGSDEHGSIDWDDDSACVCPACDRSGIVQEFRGEQTFSVDISWTESCNYSASINVLVPAGEKDPEEYIKQVLLEADGGEEWWQLLMQQMPEGHCTCSCMDDMEHKQLLSIDNIKKKLAQ